MKTLDEFVALFAEQFDETDASSFKVTDGVHEATFSPVDGAAAGTKIQASPSLTRSGQYQFANIWHNGSAIYNITIVPTV